ncbi:putative acyltransferase [Desulfosporosinus orientis DSM 765]|uniref:Putative acyltransferase n=1 Tax=Desulfosporosinus orientis (strain ATCC 19365 / DSM 765 / NCIMB 8382 / VKM B-1628 / Singapore I) TaxID=768706 RepID=G7WCA0_DESOD|nr:acyltransferase [Desulfosporosinus orientis]AET70718.1 putative acyltransferase [Desulfosporosinus orientis DSM 765]
MIQKMAHPANTGRIEEINYLRGFGVLAVIAIHTTGYFTKVESLNTLVLVNLWTDVFSQFAVPLFVFISGFVLAKNYPKDFPWSGFYRKRMRSIIPQYLLFSMLYTVYNNWMAIKNNSFFANLALVLKNIWHADASYHLWYFAIIIQLYILYPLIIKVYSFFKLKNRAEWLVVLLLIMQTSFMVGIHTSFLPGIKLNCIGFLFYFGLGIYVLDNFSSLSKAYIRQTPMLLAMSLALTVGASFAIIIGLKIGYDYNSIPAYFFIGPELIYPIFRVITFLVLYNAARSLLKKRRSILAKVTNKIGDYSFGIYLIHIFFNQWIIKLLNNYQIDYNDWIFYPTVFAVTFVLSYLSIRLISFIPFSYYLIGTQSRKRK